MPSDFKLILWDAGRINKPDDTSFPFKLTVTLEIDDFSVSSLCGTDEIVIARAMTKEAMERFINHDDCQFRTHPRLKTMVFEGPDGVIEEIRK